MRVVVLSLLQVGVFVLMVALVVGVDIIGFGTSSGVGILLQVGRGVGVDRGVGCWS